MGASVSPTPTSDAPAFLAAAREGVNRALVACAADVRRAHPGRVGEAIVYALDGPGKRLRPALMLAVYRAAGGDGDATELAAALEVIHTYSLVHDDLPCMDDDDLRRGKPTCHRAYDEATALLAGARGIANAFAILAFGFLLNAVSDRHVDHDVRKNPLLLPGHGGYKTSLVVLPLVSLALAAFGVGDRHHRLRDLVHFTGRLREPARHEFDGGAGGPALGDEPPEPERCPASPAGTDGGVGHIERRAGA